MSATLSPAVTPGASPARSKNGKRATPLLGRAAVLGAGTMGSRIAAHLANAGLPVVLLDIVPADAAASNRSILASRAIEALLKAKPAAFYENSAVQRITPGNLEDDLNLLAGCDWIIEAVSENLAIKQALLEGDPALKIDIVSHREGDAVGTHTITAKCGDDVIQIRHDALSRRSFAEGAVRAAEWICGKTGWYDFREIYPQLR